MAKEGRTFVISVGGTLMLDDIKSENVPLADDIKSGGKDFTQNDIAFDGGSCIAGPDGEWVIKPQFINR